MGAWLRAAVCILIVVPALAGGLAQGGSPPASTPPPQTGSDKNAAPPAATSKIICTINRAPASDAEKALAREDYTAALDLYGKMASTAASASRLGIIRTLIEQNKVKEAEDLALAWTAEKPQFATAAEALGEVLYRKGEMPQALQTAFDALKLDPCLARAYLLASSIQHLSGNYATSTRQIEMAYKLAPTDIEIRHAWIGTLPRARQIEELTALLTSDELDEKEKDRLKDRLAHEKDYKRSDCGLVEPVEKAVLPIRAIMDGPSYREGLALDVWFNGKRRRLEIDTGASGILLSRSAAAGLGLVHQQKLSTMGVGDEGEAASAMAHVESIKVGSLEFRNCPIQLLEKSGRLDIDGLIGGNFFAKYLLTLDFRSLQMQLNPIPRRPDEPAAETAKQDADETPVPHDRYTPPEMKDWTRIYRTGHEMFVPVSIGQAKDKLFLIDTGAGLMSISPAAAREVTKVDSDGGSHVQGISGEVKKVYATRTFTLVFGHLGLKVDSMTAFDTTAISHNTGFEVSGFLGAPVLNRLALHIDYRDNLVKFDYDVNNDPINYVRQPQ